MVDPDEKQITGFPPKVFIIGAQKAGTTQLCELLAQHEGLCLSNPKEPEFFTRRYGKGIDWYKSCFEEPQKCLVDASTSYTCRPLPDLYDQDIGRTSSPLAGVPERIYQCSPNARLIYIVRDPVDRCYSGYWHLVRSGQENRNIEDGLFNNSYHLRISKYAQQLQPYLDYFNRDQILILEFSELIKYPEKTLSACLDFIGLPPQQHLDVHMHKNKSFQYPKTLQKLNQMLSGLGGLNAISAGLQKLLPHWLVEKLKVAVSKPIPKISEDQRNVLSRAFDDEIANVKRLITK